jgi:hypothetical protein
VAASLARSPWVSPATSRACLNRWSGGIRRAEELAHDKQQTAERLGEQESSWQTGGLPVVATT